MLTFFLIENMLRAPQKNDLVFFCGVFNKKHANFFFLSETCYEPLSANDLVFFLVLAHVSSLVSSLLCVLSLCLLTWFFFVTSSLSVFQSDPFHYYNLVKKKKKKKQTLTDLTFVLDCLLLLLVLLLLHELVLYSLTIYLQKRICLLSPSETPKAKRNTVVPTPATIRFSAFLSGMLSRYCCRYWVFLAPFPASGVLPSIIQPLTAEPPPSVQWWPDSLA